MTEHLGVERKRERGRRGKKTRNSRNKYSLLLLVSFFVAAALCATGQAPSGASVVDALEGLDPVMLVEGREAQGELKITSTRGRLRYYFANEANKAAFEKDPHRYEVQLDGHCARMGAPTSGNPDLFTVHNGRIYIFGSAECKKTFDASPEDYIEAAPPVPATRSASAEARKKAEALIARAVEAAGGAARIDAVKSYQEKRLERLSAAPGPIERRSVWTLAEPGRVRRDNISPNSTYSLVATPEESFFIFKPADREARAGAAGPGQGEDLWRNFRRHPLEVLRARRGSDFQAAPLGAAQIGESAVERIAVEFGGVTATLAIDAASGRILSLSYYGRAADGRVGEITHRYADFRQVDGLTLPFACEITVKGKPLQSMTIEALTINAEIPGGFFEKPHAK